MRTSRNAIVPAAARRWSRAVRVVLVLAVAVVGQALALALALWVWVSSWSGGGFVSEPLPERVAVAAAGVGAFCAGPVAARLLLPPVTTRVWVLVMLVAPLAMAVLFLGSLGLSVLSTT